VEELNVPAPGLLSSEIATDPDADPLSAIPQNVMGTYGHLIVNTDGSLTYRPNSSPTNSIYENFYFGVYDTFGGGLHSTSSAQRLVIEIDPVAGTPKTSR
jgi:hypothetical protein